MDRPNVVLTIADQHRWDFVGHESNGVTHTPSLDRLARAGTIFRSCYTTSPRCCPARQAIASGRYGVNRGCFTNLHQLPPGTPSFVSQLRATGYHTTAILVSPVQTNLVSDGPRESWLYPDRRGLTMFE